MDVGLQLLHHLIELFKGEGLGPVAHGLLRTGMSLHDQTVGAYSHTGARHRLDQAAFACSMARIQHRGQVSQFVQNGNGRDVTSVTSSRLESTNAALAE